MKNDAETATMSGLADIPDNLDLCSQIQIMKPELTDQPLRDPISWLVWVVEHAETEIRRRRAMWEARWRLPTT